MYATICTHLATTASSSTLLQAPQQKKENVTSDEELPHTEKYRTSIEIPILASIYLNLDPHINLLQNQTVHLHLYNQEKKKEKKRG